MAMALSLIVLILTTCSVIHAYTWPDLAYDYVEEFLWLELTGFADIPAVCAPTSANPDGTTPSIQAQWLRTVRRFASSKQVVHQMRSRLIMIWQPSMLASVEWTDPCFLSWIVRRLDTCFTNTSALNIFDRTLELD